MRSSGTVSGWPLRCVRRGSVHSLGISDESPGNSLTAVGGHTVTFRNWSGGCRRADDLPISTLGANFACSSRRSNGPFHCTYSRDWLMKLPLGVKSNALLTWQNSARPISLTASRANQTNREGGAVGAASPFRCETKPRCQGDCRFSGEQFSAAVRIAIAPGSLFESAPKEGRRSQFDITVS